METDVIMIENVSCDALFLDISIFENVLERVLRIGKVVVFSFLTVSHVFVM